MRIALRTLPSGHRQIHLSGDARAWLRRTHEIAEYEPLRIVISSRQGVVALTCDPDGVTVDPRRLTATLAPSSLPSVPHVTTPLVATLTPAHERLVGTWEEHTRRAHAPVASSAFPDAEYEDTDHDDDDDVEDGDDD